MPSYTSDQPVREWVAMLVVTATIAGFAIWWVWNAAARFVEGLKSAIDSVWRDRQ